MAEICRRNTGLVSHLIASKAAMGCSGLVLPIPRKPHIYQQQPNSKDTL